MSWFEQALKSWSDSKVASADALARGISAFGNEIGAIPAAIRAAQSDTAANQLSSQLANSGNFAPRAGLVSPGISPITGAINTIKAGTPASVATQGGVVGMVPSTVGTAPAPGGGGGLPALNARLAVWKAHQEAAGGSPIEAALKRAQTDYYGAHTRYMNEETANKPIERAQALLEKQQKEQAAETQQLANTQKQVQTDFETTHGPGSYGQWSGVMDRGAFEMGDPITDPTDPSKNGWSPSATGGYYTFGNTPQEKARNAITADEFNRLDQLRRSAQQAQQRRASPGVTPTTPGTLSGGKAITSEEEFKALAPGTPFMFNGQPYVKH